MLTLEGMETFKMMYSELKSIDIWQNKVGFGLISNNSQVENIFKEHLALRPNTNLKSR